MAVSTSALASLSGLPSVVPLAFAAAMPALVRSLVSERSNSANAPSK